MIDILLIILLAFIAEDSIKRHNKMATDNIVGAALASLLMYGFVKWPVMGLITGQWWGYGSVPDKYHLLSGAVAVAFWSFLLIYRPIAKLRGKA